MKVTRSIISYLLFLVCLSVPPVILQNTGHADLMVPGFWPFFFFLSGLTLLVIGSILFVQSKNHEYYAQAFLAATTVKILALLIFILVISAKNKVDKHIFIADFIYIYFFNMGFEVYILLRNLRHK